jgi:hypothetical protein
MTPSIKPFRRVTKNGIASFVADRIPANSALPSKKQKNFVTISPPLLNEE